MRSRRVTNRVRTNPLLGQRRYALLGLLRMSFNQRMDSEASDRSTVAVQENKAVLRPACDQRSQRGHRARPQWAEPGLCTLPEQLHYSAASATPFEIGELHRCRLARPCAGVV